MRVIEWLGKELAPRSRPPQVADFVLSDGASGDRRETLATLRAANARVLRATGKKEDGLVSRFFNRPVSRAISGQLLKLAWVRPVHATAGTALIALLMLGFLLLGGPQGAIVGALLFQAASVFDGVDGEIARATFRTSSAGGRLDSLIDAATNLAFLAGLTFNLWSRGDTTAGLAGLVGIAALATGLLQIGRRAQSLHQPINFEAVKVYLRKERPNSIWTEILIWITMRDFIAAACALAVIAGFASQALIIFMVCALCWLLAITVILAVSAARGARRG